MATLGKKIKKLVRRMRGLTGDDERLIKQYEKVRQLGANSPNPYIKRSAQVPGWLFEGEHEFLYEQALQAPPGQYLEIGVLFGKSASIITGAIAERKRGEKLFAIDPFTVEGTPQDMHSYKITHGLTESFKPFVEFAKKLGYYEHMIPLATFSFTCLPLLDVKAGFAFIDGLHDFDAVLQDFELCAPKMVPGARVLFHDANESYYPGVVKAINTVLEKHPEYRKLGQAGNLLALEKKA